MLSSDIWLAIAAAVLGGVASNVIPKTIGLIRHMGFLRHNLDIRLASGEVVSVDESDADVNTVLREIINATVEHNKSQLDEILVRERIIAEANIVLFNRDYSTAPKFIEELVKLSNKNPTDRRAAITLGRLFSQSFLQVELAYGLKEAINVLSNFVAAKEDRREFDRDYADVLYNRACYKARLSTTVEISQEQQLEYRRQAISDLRASVDVAPDNAANAAVDADFDALREDREFAQIVGSRSLA